LARVTGREADVPEPAAVIPQKNVPAPEPAETIAPTPPEPAKPSSENLIAKALEGIGNATIADAKACVAKLETLAKDLPGDTDVTGVKDHLMAVCRAEATVAARVRELQKAESTAREKLRNAQIAERPSRLTGRVDMESARRYRAEAERIQSDAQRNLTEARANLATSLQDAGAFTRRRLGTPIENAWRSIATRNRIDLKK
jgi:hypothetical protein